MALIIEDGTLVTDADSWVTVAELGTHASAIGATAPTGTDAEEALRQAARHIGSLEPRLKGARVERDQSLAFPRKNVTIDGWEWSKDEIPRNVRLAQMALALDIAAGEDPENRPLADNPRNSVAVSGAVSVGFATPVPSKLRKTSTADALLRSLMKNSGLELVRS